MINKCTLENEKVHKYKNFNKNLTFIDIVDDLVVGKKRVIHMQYKMAQLVPIKI